MHNHGEKVNFQNWLENTEGYPTLRWVKAQLRNNIYYQFPRNRRALGAFIVGSVARGLEHDESDLDIAVIIEPIRGKSAMQISDDFHSRFATNTMKPNWNGRVVDFQFFYPNDPEMQNYSKIPLIESRNHERRRP